MSEQSLVNNLQRGMLLSPGLLNGWKKSLGGYSRNGAVERILLVMLSISGDMLSRIYCCQKMKHQRHLLSTQIVWKISAVNSRTSLFSLQYSLSQKHSAQEVPAVTSVGQPSPPVLKSSNLNLQRTSSRKSSNSFPRRRLTEILYYRSFDEFKLATTLV